MIVKKPHTDITRAPGKNIYIQPTSDVVDISADSKFREVLLTRASVTLTRIVRRVRVAFQFRFFAKILTLFGLCVAKRFSPSFFLFSRVYLFSFFCHAYKKNFRPRFSMTISNQLAARFVKRRFHTSGMIAGRRRNLLSSFQTAGLESILSRSFKIFISPQKNKRDNGKTV